MVRDVGLAEDLAQDALVAALERWPRDRRPRQPRRLADGDGEEPGDRPGAARRRPSSASAKRSPATLGMLMAMERSDFDAAADDEIGDDLLALIFTCCHPLLSPRRGWR